MVKLCTNAEKCVHERETSPSQINIHLKICTSQSIMASFELAHNRSIKKRKRCTYDLHTYI